MKMPTKKTVGQYLFFLGLGLGLIWYSSKDLSADQITQMKSAFTEVNYLLLVPVLACLLLSHYCRALRWKLMMAPLGFAPRIYNVFLAVMLGYFFNLLVPRLGEVMKCTILGRYEKLSPDKLIGTILAERAVDLLSLAIITVVLVIVQFQQVGAFALSLLNTIVASKSGSLSPFRLIIFLLIITGVVLVVRWIFKNLNHYRWVTRLRTIGVSIMEGLQSLQRLKNWPMFYLNTVMIWAMYLISIYIGFMAFEPVAHLGFSASLSVLVFGALGMIVTQGGIGAYQIAVEKTLGVFGINSVMGLAFGWVLWGAQTVMILVLGLVCLLLLPLVNPKQTN